MIERSARHAGPAVGRRTTRLLIVGLALGAAALPAACGTFSDGGGNTAEEDPSATTVFRTITVVLSTSTSLPPDAATGADPAAQNTLSPDVYEVQSGDYWYGIAKKLGVDVNALWAVNNANADTLLLPGRRLAVPKPGRPPRRGCSHRRRAANRPTRPRPRRWHRARPPGSYQIVAGDYWIRIAEKLTCRSTRCVVGERCHDGHRPHPRQVPQGPEELRTPEPVTRS